MTKLVLRFFVLVTCLTVTLLQLNQSAQADGLDDAKARGRLIVAVKFDYEPFGYVDAKGNNVGFDIDIAKKLAKSLFNDESKLELVAITAANRIPYLLTKKVDVIIASLTVTDDRKQIVDFTDAYFMSGAILLVPKDSPLKDFSDLKDQTIAIVQGSWEDKALEQDYPSLTRLKFPKVTDAVLAVKTGRAVAYIHDDTVVLAEVSKDPELKAAGKVYKPQPIAIAVRKGETQFQQWLNAQLAKMRQDGSLKTIWNAHFKKMEPYLSYEGRVE